MNNNEQQNLNKILNKLKIVENQNIDRLSNSPSVDKLLNNQSELEQWWDTLTDSNQTSLMCLIKQYVENNSDELLLKIKENISPDSPPTQSIGSKLKI